MNSALSRILRPLARLAVARGARFTDVAELLRRAFLTAAQQVAGPEANVSRLSVLSGLQRRDVARLLEADEPPAPRPNPLSQLVAAWLAKHGGAPLPHHGAEGSFDALARSVRKDVHPKAQLSALLAAGTAELRGEEVHLLRRAHVPEAGSAEQLAYLGANVGDHLAAAVGNVVDGRDSFDLAVHYNGLSAEAVAELDALWRAQVGPALQALNTRATELRAQAPGSERFRAGGYFHSETET
ncbi:MAG: DUF6502 family protein [Pseudomonadota bacterium]